MSFWGWLMLGLVAWAAVAGVAGFALAAALGRAARGDMTVSEYADIVELSSSEPSTPAQALTSAESRRR
jgi:hypothetical protein